MGWGISKTESEFAVLVGLGILTWFPWSILSALIKSAKEELGKNKKNGIGLI